MVHRKQTNPIPIAFQVATLLSAFAHPDYLLFVGSRGFALLPPSSNLKLNGYIYYFFAILLVTSSIGTVFAAPDIPIYTVEESSPQCSFEEAIWNSSIAPWLLAMQKLETQHANRPGMTSIKDFDAMWQTEKNKKSSALNAIINQDIQYSYKKKAPYQQIEGGENIVCHLNDDLKTNISTSLTCIPERDPTSLLRHIDAFDLSLIDSAHLLLAIDEIGQVLTKFSKQENKDESVDTIKSLDYINKITDQNNKLCHTVKKFIESLEKESSADKVAALNSIDSEALTSHKYFARFIGVVKNYFTNTSEEERKTTTLTALVQTLAQENKRLPDIQNNCLTCIMGEITWEITDFERKRQQVISKEKGRIVSPPFYAKDGRKFEAIIYLNDNGLVENKRLLIGIRAIKSPKDNLLEWPCIGWFINYKFIDKTGINKHYNYPYRTSAPYDGFYNPEDYSVATLIDPALFPLSVLKEPNKYIKNNSMTIHIQVKYLKNQSTQLTATSKKLPDEVEKRVRNSHKRTPLYYQGSGIGL